MSDRADLLLRKALQSLDADERDELLGGLLLGQLSGGMPAAAGVVGPVAPPRGAVNRDRLASLFGTEIPASTAAGVRLKVLPVRLPEAEHERLRQFCQASGRLRDQSGASTMHRPGLFGSCYDKKARRAIECWPSHIPPKRRNPRSSAGTFPAGRFESRKTKRHGRFRKG